MPDVVCPKPAYEKLVATGLDKKILEQKEDIEDVFLHNSLYSKKGKAILTQARRQFFSSDRKISEASEAYRDVLELEQALEEGDFILHEFENLLMQHPSFLGLLILGQGIFNPEQSDFPSAKTLSQAITSFCIGEKRNSLAYIPNTFTWRNGDYKNELTNGWHGDLWFHQTDVSGQETTEQGLFGKICTFDTIKNASENRKGINAHYGFWPAFLITSLKYAQAIGRPKIPEIVNWREVLQKIGAVGTATAEAEFGGGDHRLTLMMLDEEGIINADTKEKSERFPLFIKCDSGTEYYPCVLDRKLQYLKKDDSGEIDLSFIGGIFEGKRFSPHIVYDEPDLPQLLAGTYRLFARDRSIMPKIMRDFLARN